MDISTPSLPRQRTGRPKGTVARTSTAVKEVREALGLTQLEMSVKMGVTAPTIHRLERLSRLPQSHGALDALKKLAQKAGVKI